MSDHKAADRPAATATVANEEGRTVLTLSGELDLSTVTIVQGVVDEVILQGPEHLVIDLAGVTFMDSSAIALLLGTAKRLPGVELRNPSQAARRLVELTGLTGMLPIVP